MTYANTHLRFTTYWTTAGVSAELAQFGLRFDSGLPATQALVDTMAARVATFWPLATAAISPNHRASFCRLAAVSPDGTYSLGTNSFDHVFAGGIPGSSAFTGSYPLQTAHVITLSTAFPRGKAARGRVYLPPIHAILQSDFNWQLATVNSRVNSFAAMITGLNTDVGSPCTVFSFGTKTGPPQPKHAVTSVVADNRPDVQRRRARQQPSLKGTVSVV